MTHTTDTLSDERQEPAFNMMQTVKRRLYAMRNGALAAQMRNAGLDYRINFGLNIPQVKEIAADITASGMSSAELLGLANALWENVNTRESRLIAPMLYPADIMSAEEGRRWLTEAQTTEVADHLCHSLLRRLPFAEEIAMSTLGDAGASGLNRYAALRLLLNLLLLGRVDATSARHAAEEEQMRKDPTTARVAAQIISETDVE